MSVATPEEGITRDFFYKRKVTVLQRKKGYRFSLDAPLLADFLPNLSQAEALEIGTGSGIISLLALYKNKFARISCLEVQAPAAALAAANADLNGFGARMDVREADFNHVYSDYTGVRHIFANPPYFPLSVGRLSPNPEIRDARSETRLTLNQLIKNSFRILGGQGNLYLVLPAARLTETLDLALETGFYAKRLREVFSFKDGNAERFLIQLTNYEASLEKLTPLLIFKAKGVYTEETDRILNG